MTTRPTIIDAVASPCNSVCTMDERTGWCEGCHRTIDEIIAWSTMADDEKRAVWELLAVRQFEPAVASKP